MPAHQDLSGAQLHAAGPHVHTNYDSGIQHVDVQFNDTQIKTLGTTGLTLVPALGAGLIAMPLHCYCLLYLVTPYDEASHTSAKWAIGPNGIAVSGRVDMSILLGSSGVQPLVMPVVGTDLNGLPVPYRQDGTVQDNQPLMIWDDAEGAYTGGDPGNTLSIRVWYSVVPAVPFGAA